MKTNGSNFKKQFINSINLNAEMDFPYLVLEIINENSYPRNPGFQVMHWHEDLQFIYLHEGKIEIQTLFDTIFINAGEGVFINKNVVHHVKRCGTCHYNSFLFPDYFLKFYFGSPASNFVDSIVKNEQFYVLVLNEEKGFKTLLSNLKELSQLEKNKTEFYTYEVLSKLSIIWLELCKNIHLPAEKIQDTTQKRMQRFLNYIEKNYSKNLSLEELAKSINVSKSECLRCFKLSLKTSPYKYLIEYRLSKAAEMIKTSNKSIEEIAHEVGFHQISHFGKCFKEKTGYSPRDYRKLRIKNKEEWKC